MNYKSLPVSKPGEFMSDIIFVITGKTRFSKSITKLVPMIYSLAIANTAAGICADSLKKSGILKRSYYKRNKRYWKRKIAFIGKSRKRKSLNNLKTKRKRR